jgi:hypothetical protein
MQAAGQVLRCGDGDKVGPIPLLFASQNQGLVVQQAIAG